MFQSRLGHHYGETWPEFSPCSNRAQQDKHVLVGKWTLAAYVVGVNFTKTAYTTESSGSATIETFFCGTVQYNFYKYEYLIFYKLTFKWIRS